jgi:uncharacterized membrane protein
MTLFLKLYVVAIIAFLVLDGLWIGVVASGFYKKQLAYIFTDQVNFTAAALFYLIYAAGLVYLVIEPGLGASVPKVFLTGALVGLMAYGAYDFTNQATIRNWPVVVTIVDLAWGTFATAMVSVVTTVVARTFFSS